MKFKILFFISLAVLTSCVSNSHFLLMDSTSQRWSGGIKGSGTGITYNFKVKIKSDDIEGFTKAWIGNRVAEINLKRMTLEEIDNPLSKDDIVILECRLIDGDEDQMSAPIEYEGEALIEYLVGGNGRYMTVKEIEVLEKQVNY
ncbi:MAG: hypothetical protein HKN92_01920 [Chitinophagales bacterium]|nr:hypothetical protein [Chitinophagales bacterium]